MILIASTLMVTAAIPCVIGAIGSRSRLAIMASSMMLLAMADLAFAHFLPPVIWSGLLLAGGLGVAVRLRSRLTTNSPAHAMPAPPQKVLVGADVTFSPATQSLNDTAESSSLERPTEWQRTRPLPRLERTSAILSAIAYPIMAWQVLNHGTHPAMDPGAGTHTPHQHHAQTFDGLLASGVITVSVTVGSLLLTLCAAQAVARKRPGLMFESLGMATMLTVMQFMR